MRAFLVLALLASSSPVLAGEPAAKRPVATADGDKMICRRETTIGSNIPGKKVCKLKSQLLAEQAAARDAAKDMTNPAGASSNN